MKKFFLLALSLSIHAGTVSANSAPSVTPSMVGIEGSGASVYINASVSECLYGAVYFTDGTIDDRKAALAVAMVAKLSGKTLRIDYRQPGGPGTMCFGSGIYIN